MLAAGDIRRKVLRQAGGFAMLAVEAFHSAGHFIKVPGNQRTRPHPTKTETMYSHPVEG